VVENSLLKMALLLELLLLVVLLLGTCGGKTAV